MFGVCLRISKGEHTGAEEFSRMLVLLLQRLQVQRGTRKPRLTGNPWPSAPHQESQGFHSHGSQEANKSSRDRWADVLTPWKTVTEHREPNYMNSLGQRTEPVKERGETSLVFLVR